MINRIIEIADTAAKLRLENSLLVVTCPDGGKTTIPIEEIGCLILANPAVSITGALLASLARHNCAIIVSDDKKVTNFNAAAITRQLCTDRTFPCSAIYFNTIEKTTMENNR